MSKACDCYNTRKEVYVKFRCIDCGTWKATHRLEVEA